MHAATATRYLAGCGPDIDHAVEPDDLTMDADLWESKVWPVLAHRIPAFERIKVTTRWAGHYAYNTLDHNAVVGLIPNSTVSSSSTASPGTGFNRQLRWGGVAEWISYGEFRSIDLTPLGSSAYRRPAVRRVEVTAQRSAYGTSGTVIALVGACSSSGDERASFLVYRLLAARSTAWGDRVHGFYQVPAG